MSARNLIAIAVTLLGMGTGYAQEAAMSVAEAKALVGIVLRHHGFPSSSQYCAVERLDKSGDPFVPDYYSFGASCDFPNTAATSPWGVYVVSPRTGEVLEFDVCHWVGYPDLRRAQRQIVLRTHATEAAEARYREKTGCLKAK
jgi:hypothetical protein